MNDTTRPRTVDQPTAAPTRKVGAAAGGGALATIVVWVLSVTAGVEVPGPVEAAFATIIAIVAGWSVRERAL